MQKWIAVGVALPLLGLVALFMSSGAHNTVEASTPKPENIPTVAATRVESRNLARDIVLTAEFQPYQQIGVMAKVAGYVKEINVDIGDRVRKGELLATLEVPEMADDLRRDNAAEQRATADVARARDELQRAQSAYAIAHVTWQRLANVAKTQPGLVAQEEIDEAQSKALEAEAQVSAAKSGLAASQQHVQESAAEVGLEHTLMDYTRVTAPFTGVITKRYADVGSMIQAGTASQTQAEPLVQLSQNDLLRLILPVPESAVPTIHIGKPVEVTVPTLHRTFPGRVTRFADKLDLNTRTMRTEVDVPNPNLVLIPGMYAEVHLAVARANDALVLPDMAVDLNANGTSGKVMVITPNHRVEPRTVSVGLDTAKAIEVRSGLNDGDMVVLTGRAALHAGEKVRPRFVTLGAAAPEAG